MNEKKLSLNTQLLNPKQAEEVLTKIKNFIAQEKFADLFSFKYSITDDDGDYRKVIDIGEYIDKKIDSFMYDNTIFLNTDKFYRKKVHITDNKSTKSTISNERLDVKTQLYCSITDKLSQYTFRYEDSYKHQINAFLNYFRKYTMGAFTKYLNTMYEYKSKDRYNFKIVSLDNNRNTRLEKEINYYNNVIPTEEKVLDQIDREQNRKVIDDFLSNELDGNDRKIYRQNRILDLRTQKQLAEKFGVSQQAISKKVKKYDELLAEVFRAEWKTMNCSA